MSDNAVTRDPC